MYRHIIMLVLALTLVGSVAFAQQTNARIIGSVTDDDGNALPGVAVEATSPKLLGKSTSVTDGNGVYRLLNLAPGVYKLSYQMEGFQTLVRENISLSLEQTLSLNVAMKLGEIKEMITVIGKSPLIDVKSVARGMTLTKDLFNSLPKGRDFSSLVTAIPGVYNEPVMGGLSVDGASGAENVFYMDGMETGEVRGNQQRMQAAFDFIDEVQVKASGYQAEFGGSMGGVINVITRSGGNEFHGEVMGYYQGSAIRGKTRDILRLNPEDPNIAEYFNYEGLHGQQRVHRLEGGLNLGGYIVKDKLWFFGTFLPVYRDTTRYIRWSEEPGSEQTSYQRKDTWLNAQFKLSAQLAKNLRMAVSYVNNGDRWRGGLPGDDPSTNAPDWQQPGDSTFTYDLMGQNAPTWSTSGTMDFTIGNNLQISARAGHYSQDNRSKLDPPGIYYLHRYYVPTSTLDWPAENIKPNSWENYTWGLFYKLSKAHYTRTSANVDANYFLNLAGEHSWKVGFQYIQVMDDYNGTCPNPMIILRVGRPFPYDIEGSPVTSGTLGRYGYYENRSPFGTLVNKARSNRYAFYIQDSWTIGNRITLNLGLRAEKEKVPAFSDLPQYKDSVPLDFKWGDKLAPRLGFIWDVKGDSSLKVFGSFGIFQDCMKLAMPEGSYGGDRWISHYYELDTSDWQSIGVNDNFPGTYWGSLDWRIPSINITDPDIKPMSQRELSFGMEKKLNDNLSVSVRLVNKKLLEAIEDVGIMLDEGETYFIANPGSKYLQQQYDLAVAQGNLPEGLPKALKAKRDYWAVNLAMEKRFSKNWLAGFSYTWSKLTGNYAGLNSSDEPDRNDPNVNRYFDLWFTSYDQNLKPIDGRLNTDRPHYLKAYGSYSFPFGLTVGAVANAYSGVPLTTEILVNAQQGYYPLNRFDTGRRSPFTFTADFYAEYALELGSNTLNFSINVRNLTDAKTAQRLYSIYNQDDVNVNDQEFLDGGLDIKSRVEILDPQFGKGNRFLPPLEATLGLKFSF